MPRERIPASKRRSFVVRSSIGSGLSGAKHTSVDPRSFATKMKPTIVAIPVNEIVDWNTFHAVFARELGFPEFYGGNMNAWVDCMTSIDEPDDGMSTVHGTKEAGMLLDLGDCTDFARRCPAQYEAILDSTGLIQQDS